MILAYEATHIAPPKRGSQPPGGQRYPESSPWIVFLFSLLISTQSILYNLVLFNLVILAYEATHIAPPKRGSQTKRYPESSPRIVFLFSLLISTQSSRLLPAYRESRIIDDVAD